MNREQMIAWLTLEGWYPMCDEGREYYWLHHEDNRQAATAYTDKGTMKPDTGVVQWSRCDGQTHKVVGWDEYPSNELPAVYAYLAKEKDHEPR